MPEKLEDLCPLLVVGVMISAKSGDTREHITTAMGCMKKICALWISEKGMCGLIQRR